MNKLFKDKSAIFCFTPEVMLATFLTEFILAIYVFLRYKITDFNRIILAILVSLAAFQVSEYQICAGSYPLFWSKIGFVAITLLPILGLKLVSLATGKNDFLKFGYTAMLVYIFIFLFVPRAINNAVCEGNYIIFHTSQNLSWTYSVYYFGFLLLAIWKAIEYRSEKNKSLLNWIIAGYISFMLPMAIVYFINPLAAWNAAPSIMCGFALIMAFILAFKIAPRYKEII